MSVVQKGWLLEPQQGAEVHDTLSLLLQQLWWTCCVHLEVNP